MAKKKTTNFLDEIKAKTGGLFLEETNNDKYFIDTGNLALNYVCSKRFIGGGIPGGKIVEFYGPSASSKSLLGWSVLAGCQRMNGVSALIDCEHAANADFALAAGHIDTGSLLYYDDVITLQDCERKITNLVRNIREHVDKEIPILIGWDSISVCPTDREWKETDLPEDFSKADFDKIVGRNEQPGERAKVSSAILRKLNPFLSMHNASLYVINQVRSAIGVLYGNPEVVGGGGKSLEFYCSTRLRTSAHKMIEDKKKKKVVGTNLKFAVKKSRYSPPKTEVTDVQLWFDHGVNPLSGLLSALISAGRIEEFGRGSFKVLEPWADGKDVKIKSSLTRNDVPLEFLLACPALVDAKSSEEILEYLSPFDSAIKMSYSDDIEEKGVEDSSDD